MKVSAGSNTNLQTFKKPLQKVIKTSALFQGTLSLVLAVSFLAEGQTNTSKTYRGTIGDKHIEMRLDVQGSNVTGTYFYDQFKQDIKLQGAYDGKGQLELTEFAQGKRKTGKFVCKGEPATFDLEGAECEWSRPDGTGKAFVTLVEQGTRFKKGMAVVPRFINDRKSNVVLSYPQLTTGVTTQAIDDFNKLVETLVQKAIKEFQRESPANSAFDTNYNVMLADDDLVSIEMEEYSNTGGAHPNSRLWTVNYNLKTNKQLSLADVFLPGDDYKQAIAEFVVKDINRRADKIERDEARRNNRLPEKRDEPMITLEQLPEMDTWALSAKGFAVYFDFPHVIAVFDKTVVPYSLLARYLRPDGVIPLVR
jgi:Deacetylase PdaC